MLAPPLSYRDPSQETIEDTSVGSFILAGLVAIGVVVMLLAALFRDPAADALAGHPQEGPVAMFAVPADPFAISAAAFGGAL